MRIKKYSLCLFLAVFFCNSMFAQTILTASSYFCDFEGGVDSVNWVLNNGPKAKDCANKWYWGAPGFNRGESGLYISGNNGQSADYAKAGVSVIAYREFNFDAGDYVLSFDWRAGGTTFSDGLYVCWIPKEDGVRLNSAATGVLHGFVEEYGLDFGRDSLCLNQKYWNTIADTISTDGSAYYLVFVWHNGSSEPYSPGACIDDLMIIPKGLCNSPLNLKVNPKGGSDVLVSWEGDAEAYDVQVYCYKTKTWYEYKDIKEKYITIQGLEEGMKSFYVRSVCGEFFSVWASQEKFLYYPAIRCIDYLNLNSNNCWIGNYDNPMTEKKLVDFGSRSSHSRHTIHWDETERDPRTGGLLKTVPDGELASVRLGNNRTGAEGEGIEYNFLVDTTMGAAVLLLNYAVVLEDPAHSVDHQPRFTLNILDQNNRKLDQYGCGEANFAAGYDTSEEDGWSAFPGGWWKDWTTVAIDLRRYHGQSLKICFKTYDCQETGHFGYAYFTLGCSDGKVRGLTCATGDSTEFLAPYGFKYKWYSPKNPEVVLSTEQKFSIAPDDTASYYLDVIQPTNKNCYYTMEVSGMGRLPRANAEYSLDIKNCENIVKFENRSYVQRFNQVTNDSSATEEKCEEIIWDFGDGNTSTLDNPIHQFPDEGGTYTIRLTAKIANGQCDDDTTFTITLPKLGTTIDTLNAVICEGEGYVFKGDTIFDSGCYVDSAKNIYGCDSIAIVNLFVAEKYDSTIYDTICSTDIYFFHGNQITETGIYTANLKSIYDCDSIVHLDVVVIETLILDVDSVIVACCDDECIVIPYELRSGVLDEYSFEFVGNALSIPFSDLSLETDAFVIKMPENLIPNRYECIIKFGERSCGKEEESVFVDLRYSKEVLVQRWGDVLAVRNSDYNGGYEFISYQWYKNGEIIDGATSSILYEETGLDLTAEYSVMLTRVSDNISAMTCVAELFDFSSVVNDMVVVLQMDGQIEIETQRAARLKIWSIQGVLVEEIELVGGHNSIANLNLEGVYLLEFIFENNQREIRQIVFN